MTTIELTSGEILDIVEALRCKADQALQNDKMHLFGYYTNLAESFRPILKTLETLPGEHRIAKLVMAL